MKCPSLNPKCEGTLHITQRAVACNSKQGTAGWFGYPLAAACDKCGKRYTQEQLRVEGIDINQVDLT